MRAAEVASMARKDWRTDEVGKFAEQVFCKVMEAYRETLGK
jgi:hypothetical protein